MKYQFQFAGANVSRRSAPQKGRWRIAILAAVLVLAALAYANYLFNIFHLPFHRAPVVAVPQPVTATAVAAAPAKSAVKESVAVATAVKTTTDAGKVSVANPVVQPLTVAQTAPTASVAPAPVTTTPVAPAVPAAPVAAAPVTPKVISVTTIPASQIISEPLPTVSRPIKEHTPQDRLLMAGQSAFAMTMDMATKYPDAYGFRAEDVFADAKLGDPMPIYTVEEPDRAAYKRGEPVKPILKEAKQWAFPVTVNHRVACMVTVTYSHHDYVPGKGSKILGMAWDKITEKWPAEEGYHPCIVINSAVPGYYFTVPELPQPNMTDIVRLFDYHLNLSPADVILASWR